MAALLALPREQCASCSSYRALFCPECNGLRTQERLLPPSYTQDTASIRRVNAAALPGEGNRSTGAHSLALVEGAQCRQRTGLEKEVHVMKPSSRLLTLPGTCSCSRTTPPSLLPRPVHDLQAERKRGAGPSHPPGRKLDLCSEDGLLH